LKLDCLSATRINTFVKCPLQYHAVYELGYRDDVQHPLAVMGTAVHKMMEIYVKDWLRGQRSEDEDPLKLREAVCKRYKVDTSLHGLIDELGGNAVRWGYFRNLESTKGCEIPFNKKLSDGTPITGYIDRLDIDGNTADIIDIKTQKREFSDEELNGNWQAKMYDVAVRLMYPEVTKTRISFWMLRHMVQRVSFDNFSAARNEEELMDMAEQIRNCSEPKGNITPLCQWCPYVNDCKVYKGGIKSQFKGFNK